MGKIRILAGEMPPKFGAADANMDGMISMEEAMDKTPGPFNAADGNMDGFLDMDEYKMYTFKMIDMDNDGKISLPEYVMSGRKQKMFAMLDTGGDGFIDPDEWEMDDNDELRAKYGYGKKEGSSFSVYEPSQNYIVKKMLKIAKVQKGETVFDIGCGDGRSIAMAAKDFGAKGIGIELDKGRAKLSRKLIKKLKLTNSVEVRNVDGRTVKDYGKADVVFLYLTDYAINILKPIFESQLKKGTRIVSHGFAIPGWKIMKYEVVGKNRNQELTWRNDVYLYEFGKHK